MSKTETREGRVARDFTLEEVAHTKGNPITLPKNQFDDLEGVGLVEPVAAAEKAAVKPADTGKAG